MTRKSPLNSGKSVSLGHGHIGRGHSLSVSAVTAALKNHIGVPVLDNHVGLAVGIPKCGAANDICVPVHVSTKEDIEKELAKIEERFGMSPEEFYEAWKNDEFHGFQAMKFGCLYEFYRDEFE